jgi:transcriptional regulator with XRE-family HTH domain
MAHIDPFEGLGKALAHLREKAGFVRQAQAAEALGFERAQLSRWETDSLRPTLENLGRLLAGYGASLTDLANAIGGDQPPTTRSVDRGPSDEDLIRSLTEAIRRVEGRQVQTEDRIEELAGQIRRDSTGRGTG